MTLTNDQCIQIAELWGWYEDTRGKSDRLWRSISPDTGGGQLFNIDELKEEVNSWSGFGRTVEAMGGKGFFLRTCDYNVSGSDLEFYTPASAKSEIIDWWGTIPTSLIKATHLAALEAVNNEKD